MIITNVQLLYEKQLDQEITLSESSNIYLLLSMNNENKLDRIGVQLQNEPLTISFVSTFCLGC